MLSNHLILCRPLLFMSSIFPSIRVFSNKSALRIRWPKYWSFSFSNSHICMTYMSRSRCGKHSGIVSCNSPVILWSWQYNPAASVQQYDPEKEIFIREAVYRYPAPAWSDSWTDASDQVQKGEEERDIAFAVCPSYARQQARCATHTFLFKLTGIHREWYYHLEQYN